LLLPNLLNFVFLKILNSTANPVLLRKKVWR
jgi:hypothetical protein